MEFRIIILLIVTFIYFGSWFGIFLKAKEKKIGLAYGLFVGSLAFWTLGLAMFYYCSNPKWIDFWARELYTAGLFIPASFLYFSFIFFPSKKKIKTGILSFIFFPPLISIYLFFFTKIIIKDIFLENNIRGFVYGYGHIFFDFFICLLFLFSFIRFWIAYKNSSGIAQNRFKYILYGTVFGVILAFISNVFIVWFGIFDLIWLGPLFILIWWLSCMYAIGLNLPRMGIFLLVYAVVLGLPFGIGYKYQKWQISSILIFILASIGPFFYRWIIKQVDKDLEDKEKKYHEKILTLGEEMMQVKTKEELFNLFISCYTIENPSYIQGISLYLNDQDGNYNLVVNKGEFNNNSNKLLPMASPLGDYIYQHRNEFFKREEIAKKIKKISYEGELVIKAIYEQMQSLNLLVIFPLSDTKEDKVLGFLGLCSKRADQDYTNGDLLIFDMIAKSLVSGINNIKNLQEQELIIKKYYNEKQIKELGIMASGMGHQLLNHLAVISSQVDEMLYFDDLSKKIEPIYPELKEKLEIRIKKVKSSIEQTAILISTTRDYSKKYENKEEN